MPKMPCEDRVEPVTFPCSEPRLRKHTLQREAGKGRERERENETLKTLITGKFPPS